MKLNSRHFPHPVLYYMNDNFTDSDFSVSMEQIPLKSTGQYSFGIRFQTNNVGLKKLIEEGKAVFAAHFECSQTRYRNIFSSVEEEMPVDIPGDNIDGRVVARFFILATTTIEAYQNDNFHSDYEGFSFKVFKGDILAIAKEKEFNAIKKIHPIGNVSSIFEVIRNDSKKAPAIDYSLPGDKITISLSRENYNNFKSLKRVGGYEPLLASLIITPVLSSILEQIKCNFEGFRQYEDTRWYRSLSARMLAKKYDMSKLEEYDKGTVAIAQDLIGDTLSISLSGLLQNETNKGSEEPAS